VTNCAFRSVTTKFSGTPRLEIGTVDLTADPFVDSVNGNYALNTTAGGGAACRNAGFGTFTGLASTLSYPDIGAVQAAAQAGGVPISRLIGGI
jgi:hypothetical protein